MKKLLGSVALTTCLATSAIAADMRMPVKAPPPVAVAYYGWTGCYIGGHVGWHHTRSQIDVAPDGAASAANLNPGFIGGAFPRELTSDGSGITGGGHIGCNWQTNNFVYGLEADFSGSSADGDGIALRSALGFVDTRATYEHEVKWYGTLRARAGVLVQPRALAYVTGGFAYGRVNMSYSQAQLVGGVFNNFSAGSHTDTAFGWTAGGGLEWAMTDNWLVRAEYLFIRLSPDNFISNTVLPTCNAAGACQIAVSTDHINNHVARVGLSYKFGAPLVARY